MNCIPKPIVLYSPIPPPPLVWVYTCERCRYFTEPDKCTKVCGNISRGAWCGIWTPQINDGPFSWINNMHMPDKEPTNVILKRNIRKLDGSGLGIEANAGRGGCEEPRTRRRI